MKRSIIKFILVVITILVVFFILFAVRDTSIKSVSSLLANADALERHLEMGRHDKLLLVKSYANATLAEFTNDGCSGGLSVGWEYLATKIPDFEKTHGSEPAWQSCCEAHDQTYHAGGSRTDTSAVSFEARRKADLELKICVLKTGNKRSPELTLEYHLSEPELKQIYAGIANMMYGAVRIGGMPCTDLSWRWDMDGRNANKRMD